MADSESRTHGTTHGPDGAERRLSPRLPASELPHLRARLLAGPDVHLVDISRRGILVETDIRLMPGSPIRVKFVTDDATLVLKGAVVRSTVARVTEAGMRYRTAVAFEEDIELCDPAIWERAAPVDSHAPADPVTGERPGHPSEEAAAVAPGAVATPLSSGAQAPGPVAPARTATVLTLFASSSEEFRSLLAANDW